MILNSEDFKTLYQECDLQIEEIEEVVKRGHVEVKDFDSVEFRNRVIAYAVLDLIYGGQHRDLIKEYLGLVVKFMTPP